MKTFYKIMTGLAASLLALGVILGGVSVANGALTDTGLNGFSFRDVLHADRVWEQVQGTEDTVKVDRIEPEIIYPDPITPEVENPASVPVDSQNESAVTQYAVKRLDMELGAGEFEIVPGEEFTVTTASGSLNGIKIFTEGETWHIQANGTALRRMGKVTIVLPADFTAQEVDIELGAGSLYADGLRASRADIEVGAGRAEFYDCNLGDADLECAMGEIVYTGGLTGRGNISCGMGNVEIKLANADSFGYSVDCGVGNVDVLGYSYSGLGAQAMQNANAAVFYAIDCGMGNVSIRQ